MTAGPYNTSPGEGSIFWRDGVATASLLPGGNVIGEARIAQDTGTIYVWNGSSWTSGSGGISGGGVTGQIALFTGTSSVGGSTSLTWDGSNLTIGSGSNGIKGRTDGSSAASGVVGEIASASQNSLTGTGVGSSGAFGSVTSLTLTAGDWELFGLVQFAANGAVLTTGVECGISTSSTGAGIGAFDVTIMNNLISGTSSLQVPTPRFFASISSDTTYYLNSMFNYTSGSPQHAGKITAVRRR